jgi:hypothetical protein
MSIALGGNASGKTAAAGKKCADFVMTTPPPRVDTPFWIVAGSYEQVCSVCWSEKLSGAGFLPEWVVDRDRIVWLKPNLNWPMKVPLRKWPNGNNWLLEFKSIEQGREAMQARSIGGVWLSEQFPFEVFLEILRGCRDYMFPGGQFAEFTPIDPDLCVAIEKIMDKTPPGWKFYRLNTEKNRKNLAADWYDQFFAAVPEEMIATRKTGALATFEGVIYQTFNPAVHIVDDDSRAWLPGMLHHRAFDWGASVEHPMAGVWGCCDGMGDWLIYDEYWDTAQDKITQDHAADILARSIAWGWPEPAWFRKPHPSLENYAQIVRDKAKELCPRGLPERRPATYGDSFADPSRPGELAAFNRWGISTWGASNDVLKGIDLVRSRLKPSMATGRPRLLIHRRCTHLIDEMRKYRWLKNNNKWGHGAAARVAPLKKDDDTCDCLRYLLMSVEATKGIQPSSTHSQAVGQHRLDVQLSRPGNSSRHLAPIEAAASGFFRR